MAFILSSNAVNMHESGYMTEANIVRSTLCIADTFTTNFSNSQCVLPSSTSLNVTMSHSPGLEVVPRLEELTQRSEHQIEQERFLDLSLLPSDKDRFSARLFFMDVAPPEPQLLLFRASGRDLPARWMIPSAGLLPSKKTIRENLKQLCGASMGIKDDDIPAYFKLLELVDDEGKLWGGNEKGKPIVLNYIFWYNVSEDSLPEADWRAGLYERKWIVERSIESLDDFYPNHLADTDTESEAQPHERSREDLQAIRDTCRAVFRRAGLYTKEIDKVYAGA